MFTGCKVELAPLDLDGHISSCQYNQPEPSSAAETRTPCAFQRLGCKEVFVSHEELAKHMNDNMQEHINVSIMYLLDFSMCIF